MNEQNENGPPPPTDPEATREINPETMISECTDVAQLFGVLDKLGTVEGSEGKKFTAGELKKIIFDYIWGDMDQKTITRKHNLRKKAMAFSDEIKKMDQEEQNGLRDYIQTMLES